MKGVDRRKYGSVALMLGILSLITLSATRVAAQVPVIIPGLPGANLPAGARPAPSVWPYTDLPGGKGSTSAEKAATTADTTEAPADTTESLPPTALPYGITGDWFGSRDALFDAGIDLRTNLSQFYQGVTSGGLRQTFPYGLKFDYFATIEGEKLLGWEGLFVNLHAESRFGQSINRDVGSLIPANFALEFPKSMGSASALTNVQIEQFLGPDFVVTCGKLNAADGVNIHPFLGGNGINRFMNEAFVLSPLYGRLIPYSTPGAGFSYLRNFDPVFTFLVLDPSGRPDTAGISHMFNNGATLFSSLRARDAVRLARPPNTGRGLCQRSVQSALSRRLHHTPRDPRAATNGLVVGELRLRSVSLYRSRRPDQRLGDFCQHQPRGPGHQPGPLVPESWGRRHQPVARTVRGLVGRRLLLPGDQQRPPPGPRDLRASASEQGVELYYNAAITSWFTLTADIQAIDPAQVDSRSAFLFGSEGEDRLLARAIPVFPVSDRVRPHRIKARRSYR